MVFHSTITIIQQHHLFFQIVRQIVPLKMKRELSMDPSHQVIYCHHPTIHFFRMDVQVKMTRKINCCKFRPFLNALTDYPSSKSLTNQVFSTTARTSSSASSSSSIDDALIQLTQKQQQHSANLPQLFNDPSNSFFQFPSLPSKSTTIDQQQEQALHENLNFLASMAVASTPITPVHSPSRRSTNSLQSISTRNSSISMQELIQNLNELCDKGFDELNVLIQEQRWVRYATRSPCDRETTFISFSINRCSLRACIDAELFIIYLSKISEKKMNVMRKIFSRRFHDLYKTCNSI